MKKRGHVFSRNPMNLRIREMIFNATDDIHALNDVSDGAESNDKKFGHAL